MAYPDAVSNTAMWTLTTDSTSFYGTSIVEQVGLGRIPLSALILNKERKMRKQLFWVAVLYHKGKKTTLVIEPEIMLATSEEKARAGIINLIPASFKERFDRLEVVVRPF